jgi:hypothetical protein
MYRRDWIIPQAFCLVAVLASLYCFSVSGLALQQARWCAVVVWLLFIQTKHTLPPRLIRNNPSPTKELATSWNRSSQQMTAIS